MTSQIYTYFCILQIKKIQKSNKYVEEHAKRGYKGII